MMAMPTLPPILRMRLKMLVAFPIFSGWMRDMASDISGMKRKLERDALQHLGPEDIPEAGVEIEPGELEHGDGAQHHANQEQAPRIGLGGQVAGQRSEQQRSDAAWRQREAGVVGGISHQRLQIERQQDQAGIKDESQHADEEDSGAEGAVLEHAQIDDGMVGHQFANDERDQAEHAESGEDADVLGRKPVFALPGIEQDLQRADAEGQKTDSPQIDSARCRA